MKVNKTKLLQVGVGVITIAGMILSNVLQEREKAEMKQEIIDEIKGEEENNEA